MVRLMAPSRRARRGMMPLKLRHGFAPSAAGTIYSHDTMPIGLQQCRAPLRDITLSIRRRFQY